MQFTVHSDQARGTHCSDARDVEERAQTRAEEVANAISHALAFVLALSFWPSLMEAARERAGLAGQVAATVFCISMALQYAASVCYHGLPRGLIKRRCQQVDHAAIFLFIAGTSMPFTLGQPVPDAALQGLTTHTIGATLIWTLALAGAVLKLRGRLTDQRISIALYLVFAAVVLAAAWPTVARLAPVSLLWLAGGGVAYALGVAFFAFDASLRFGHLVWHLFALAGSTCHICAALG